LFLDTPASLWMRTPASSIDTESVADQVDKRNQWRREEDIRRNGIVAALAITLVGVGIAWGTATAAVAQKVDRAEFAAYVAAAERRFTADSVERSYQTRAWERIEGKIDSTNTRLSRLICERGPSYCQ
jgi:hypothetical protein